MQAGEAVPVPCVGRGSFSPRPPTQQGARRSCPTPKNPACSFGLGTGLLAWGCSTPREVPSLQNHCQLRAERRQSHRWVLGVNPSRKRAGIALLAAREQRFGAREPGEERFCTAVKAA